MYRWQGLDEVPAEWGESVVTIGKFDGVHRGHQRIVERAAQLGRERGLPVVAVTFDPHPDEVVPAGQPPRRSSAPPGVGPSCSRASAWTRCACSPSRWSSPGSIPDEFVRAVLVARLHTAAVVVGEDFRFGHKAAGDVTLLAEAWRDYDYTTEGLPLLAPGRRHDLLHPIRALLAAGRRSRGGEGCSAVRTGSREIVVRGHQRGRQLGFPTANVESPPHTAIPANGVYAGWLATLGEAGREARRWPAAISIGTNPTFDGTSADGQGLRARPAPTWTCTESTRRSTSAPGCAAPSASTRSRPWSSRCTST